MLFKVILLSINLFASDPKLNCSSITELKTSIPDRVSYLSALYSTYSKTEFNQKMGRGDALLGELLILAPEKLKKNIPSIVFFETCNKHLIEYLENSQNEPYEKWQTCADDVFSGTFTETLLPMKECFRPKN